MADSSLKWSILCPVLTNYIWLEVSFLCYTNLSYRLVLRKREKISVTLWCLELRFSINKFDCQTRQWKCYSVLLSAVRDVNETLRLKTETSDFESETEIETETFKAKTLHFHFISFKGGSLFEKIWYPMAVTILQSSFHIGKWWIEVMFLCVI